MMIISLVFIIFSASYASYHAQFRFPHFLSHFQPEARFRVHKGDKKKRRGTFVSGDLVVRLGNPDDLQLTATCVWLFEVTIRHHGALFTFLRWLAQSKLNRFRYLRFPVFQPPRFDSRCWEHGAHKSEHSIKALREKREEEE